MPGLTPACAHVRQSQKLVGPYFSIAPSDYDPFGLKRDAFRGRHFAADKELMQSFRDVVEAGNFTTLLYTVLLNVSKSELKVTQTLWKNRLIITKDI
jgi:hypothetical protein